MTLGKMAAAFWSIGDGLFCCACTVVISNKRIGINVHRVTGLNSMLDDFPECRKKIGVVSQTKHMIFNLLYIVFILIVKPWCTNM